PAEGEHLLLAAAHGPRDLLHPAAEDREGVDGTLDPRRLLAGAAEDSEVLPDGQGWEDAATLGDETDPQRPEGVRGTAGDVPAVDDEPSAGRFEEARGDAQQRRLPGAVRSQQSDDRIVRDDEGDVPQNGGQPVAG